MSIKGTFSSTTITLIIPGLVIGARGDYFAHPRMDIL
jgi:hypothetical protein